MRGINISSIIFVLFIFWNIFAISFLYKKIRSIKHRKNKIIYHKGIHSYRYILGFLIGNTILIICLIYFSITIGVTHYSIHSNKIPLEFHGYKIMQISDFHKGSFYGGTEKLIDKVAKEKPDIITITGDIIDEKALDYQSTSDLVSQLKLFAPVYFVAGNHDVYYPYFSEMINELKNKGVVVLQNQEVTIEKGNSQIYLYGIDDPNISSYTSEVEFLKKKMNQLKPQNGYNILIFHRANLFDALKGNGFQLILAGHMHGGQVQIPFVGGLISPHKNRRWFPKYTDGVYNEEGTTMVVSRGLGNIVPVPRVLNPPEVVLVTLKHTED